MQSWAWIVLGLLGLGLGSCGPTQRRSGQVEMFSIEQDGDLGKLEIPRRTYTDSKVTFEQARIGSDARVDPELGDLVRFTTDSVTLTVPSVYLDHLPTTLSSITTGRYDAMLFAEVWENAAMDQSMPAINRIVHVALDQPVPGRLNFQDAIAYGPTNFKGHPIRVKFTLVLLQRRAKEAGDTAAKSLQDFVSLAGAGTSTGAAASTVVALIRQVMRSLPDVEAFDFEVTFYPYNPPSVMDTIATGPQTPVAHRLTAVQRTGDVGDAHQLGEVLLNYSESLAEARYEPLRQAVADLADSKPGGERAEVIARIDRAQQLAAPPVATEQLMAIRSSISSDGKLAAEDIARVQTTQARINKALEDAAGQEFVRVREGAEKLRNATTADDVRAAIQKIQSCGDFYRIEGVPRDVQAIGRAINARPWFRYSMYALVETAHYRSGGSTPQVFEMAGARFANERLSAGISESGKSPNWMLVDVIPGLQPVDDRTIRAASEAADKFRELSGYIPSRQLAEDPNRLSRHFDTIRGDTFETLIAVRAERVAVDLARQARSKGESISDIFVPDGPFTSAFEIDLDALGKSDSWITTHKARWLNVADRVRREFDARFK